MAADQPTIDDVVHIVPMLLAIVDLEAAQIIDMNDFGIALLGYQRHEIVGRDFREIVHEIDQRPDQIDTAEGRTHLMLERRLQRADGSFMNFSLSGAFHAGSEHIVVLAGHAVDDLASADSPLADLLQLAELTDDLFLVTDKEGNVRYANRAAAELHGAPNFEGRHLSEFVHESDEGFEKLLRAYRNHDHKASARTTGIDGDGNPVVLSVETIYDPTTERWFSVQRDIRELLAQEERLAALTRDLERRASTDDLTGVANRSALQELIDGAIARAAPFGLLMMDMDDFKSVNDTLGHGAGDQLLITVAERLSDITGARGTVGRLGGDEFLLFLPDVDEMTAASLAAEIIESIGTPFTIGSVTISRSCSIGIALNEPGDTASTVLRRADQAAYQAKHAGRSRFKVHGGPAESWPTSLAGSGAPHTSAIVAPTTNVTS